MRHYGAPNAPASQWEEPEVCLAMGGPNARKRLGRGRKERIRPFRYHRFSGLISLVRSIFSPSPSHSPENTHFREMQRLRGGR